MERGELLYLAMASVDGFIEDTTGGFEWAAPDEEVHQFVNDLMRPVTTHLYGRRLYETMAVWETDPSLAEEAEVMRDFAELWQQADKVVFSTSLEATTTSRTRLEHSFDADLIRRLKAEATGPLAIGGADLAGQAVRAGLVDEYHLLVAPVLVGGGKRALPEDLGPVLDLELVEQRRFDASGVTYLRYRLGGPRPQL